MTMRNGSKALLTAAIVGGAGLGIFALSKRAAAIPGISVSKMEVGESGPYDGFYNVIFSAKITNTGSIPQSLQLVWGSNYLGQHEEESSRIISLAPGATYSWSTTYTEVFDFYRNFFTCKLTVDGAERVGVWR
jgi:hypothetical protein